MIRLPLPGGGALYAHPATRLTDLARIAHCCGWRLVCRRWCLTLENPHD